MNRNEMKQKMMSQIKEIKHFQEKFSDETGHCISDNEAAFCWIRRFAGNWQIAR